MRSADELARLYFGGDGFVLKRTDAIEIGRELALAARREALAQLREPSEEVVEAAARGAWEFSLPESEPPWEMLNQNTQEVYRIDARAALAAAADAMGDNKV